MALNWNDIIIISDWSVSEEVSDAMIFASGVPGQAATIDQVTVEQLPYTSNATVENLGTPEHAHIKFGIPRGVPGNESINDNAGFGDTDYVWSADKSTKSIKSVLNSIKSTGIGDICYFASGYIALYQKNVGDLIDITPVSNSTTVYAIVPCQEGDIFKIYAKGGNSAKAFATLDSTYHLMRVRGTNTTLNTSIQILEDEAYVIVNSATNIDYYAYKYPTTFDTVSESNIIKKSENWGNEYFAPKVRDGVYYDITAIGTTVDVSIPSYQNGLYSTIFELPEGYSIYLNGVVGGGTLSAGARAYAFLDKDYVVLDRASPNVSYTDTYFSKNFPTGTKYVIINTTSIDNLEIVCFADYADYIKNKTDYTDSNKHITDFSKYDIVAATINASSLWYTGSRYTSCFISINHGFDKKITVKANSSNDSYVSFLNSNVIGANASRVTTWARNETARHVIPANTTQEFYVSSDCAYIFVTLVSSGATYAPEFVNIKHKVNYLEPELQSLREEIENFNPSNSTNAEEASLRAIALNAEGHDLPQGRSVLNGFKRAHQLKDIQWTALSAIPGSGSHTAISAGNHTGVLYSSVKEYDKYVGWNVSIRTFMTAVHNPYSLLYTEDTFGTRSESAYGITYHGINCGGYFGIVCNIFALYAVGWDIPWNTAEFAYLCSIGKLKKVYDQSASGMRLLDIIWEPGHANVILDIERNSYGEPVYIWWGESISYFPTIRKYTPEEVNTRLATKGGIIYYAPDLYKNLNYTPSPFVPLFDEDPEPYVYNDDICTYAGDYACFYEGEDIYINYTAGTYTQMEVYKGDTLIETINLNASEHAVKITPDGYGKYKARLTNGTSNSDYTYFEIIDTTVSCSLSGSNLTVNFSSENGTPQYAQLTYRNGSSRGIIPISAEDIENGSITFNPNEVLQSQYPGQSFSEATYIKVFFVGDYGIVRNDFLNTGIYSG